MNLKRITVILMLTVFLITSCANDPDPIIPDGRHEITDSVDISAPSAAVSTSITTTVTEAKETEKPNTAETMPAVTDAALSEGRFEGELCKIKVEYISGTQNAFILEGHTLYFNELTEDSVYAISGKLYGNIVINVGNNAKLDLELRGLSLISTTAIPICVQSGNEVSITAKKDHTNYIYDDRAAVENEEDKKAAIYSEVDLEICGKGALNVVSQYNNGIHTKDDLKVKNLSLYVKCTDNALKGNDSVKLTDCSTMLIATKGDAVKTTNSSVSEKGNQKGTITVDGGNHTLYAACDGLDAAYDVCINNDSTVLNIFTDKYSEYSEEVTAVSEELFYIRFTNQNYNYSVKFINDSGEYIWVNAEYHSKVNGGWNSSYYYYSLKKPAGYSSMQVFIYSSGMKQGQEEDFLLSSDVLAVNTTYDTFALTARYSSISFSWTNYTTKMNNMGGRPGGMGGGPGGPGGFGDGNSDKGDYSTKGIKAANEIVINDGNVSIKSYDDAVHANNDSTLENGEKAKGNVTVNGGSLELYSNDDGIHADNTLTVNGGNINITNSYEGLEGVSVVLNNGRISILAKDDGINSTASSGTGVHIKGGYLYIYCTGDGIDSNSRTYYSGIVFDRGDVVVISNSGMNSAIDTEQGYAYNGGRVLAIMPQGGMSSEATHCKNFSTVGVNKNVSFKANELYSVTVDGETVLTFRSPLAISCKAIYLGSKSAQISSASVNDVQLDANGVYWK